MLKKLFGTYNKQPETNTITISTLDKLSEALEDLENKEKILQNKASLEEEKARKFITAKNKKSAKQCLMRKRQYEAQIENLGNYQLRIHDQMIILETATATTDTINALRTGSTTIKKMQKDTHIDNVDKIMDEINEQTTNMKQIQEALSAPTGSAMDFDEDELEAELEELEATELEEQLLRPAILTPEPPAHVPAAKAQQTHPVTQQKAAEDEELAALQAEMAL